ncbi:hypothetical protein WMY93_016178 [Mugilogobius chulae]|uniref:Amidohydrolase-related domain-containing protein n=1 Tax=Mugilogobius chulae TaxID=88201 RepID=A0AAW0P364_9GOBI
MTHFQEAFHKPVSELDSLYSVQQEAPTTSLRALGAPRPFSSPPAPLPKPPPSPLPGAACQISISNIKSQLQPSEPPFFLPPVKAPSVSGGWRHAPVAPQTPEPHLASHWLALSVSRFLSACDWLTGKSICGSRWQLSPSLLKRLFAATGSGENRTMSTNAGSMRILIKGGKVVNDDFTQEADVYIENGIIQQVGRLLQRHQGGSDGRHHYGHGAGASEQHCSLVDAFEKCKELADAKTCCDYSLHVGVTWWGPKVRNEMEALAREHGVNSFQMYMAYKDLMMLRDSELYQTLQTCKDIGAIARVHAENGELVAEGAKEALELGITGPEGIEISRPEELESEATHRAITIANRARCPVYLINVSSTSAGDMIAAARMQGKVVHAETTVAHAVLSGMQYYHQDWTHAAAHVLVPPLRIEPNTPNYLMGLLGNDTLSVVASEHRPFNVKQKALGKEDFTKIPHGVPGVQDRMSVIWERGVVTGKMDENRFVAVTSSNAAKIYNLYPRKGRIIAGADADVVVWDPDATKTISVSSQVQGGDFNLYEGLRCHGVPLVTISRGRLVCENGVFMCAEGSGKYYPQRIFPDYLYKKMVQREKTQIYKGVERDPYSGDVAKIAVTMKKELGLGPIDGETPKGARAHVGVRDLHESSFSLSGSQVDDHIPKRSSARILAPPGGRSSGIW